MCWDPVRVKTASGHFLRRIQPHMLGLRDNSLSCDYQFVRKEIIEKTNIKPVLTRLTTDFAGNCYLEQDFWNILQYWLAIMISNDPSCSPLGGTAPPREAKKQKVCDISANPVHRVAPWFKLLMRGGLSQDSGYDRSAFSFLPGLAWAGELWQKNRADFWGQEM